MISSSSSILSNDGSITSEDWNSEVDTHENFLEREEFFNNELQNAYEMVEAMYNAVEVFEWVESQFQRADVRQEEMYNRVMHSHAEFRRLIVAKNWRVLRFFPSEIVDDDENGLVLLALMKSRGELVSYLETAVQDMHLQPLSDRQYPHNLELVHEKCSETAKYSSRIAESFCSAFEILIGDKVHIEDIFWLVSHNPTAFLEEMIIN